MYTSMQRRGQDDSLKLREGLFAEYLEKQEVTRSRREREDEDERTRIKEEDDYGLERRSEEDRKLIREREAEDQQIRVRRAQEDMKILHKRKEEDGKRFQLTEASRKEKAEKRRLEDLGDRGEYEANKRVTLEKLSSFVEDATDAVCEGLARPRAGGQDQGQPAEATAQKKSGMEEPEQRPGHGT
ncbi:uncharacterized protein A1O5_12450 [Cladophialophora psammophila CBS 110553]|uniref:Uncharacterized protein n=1 Tax=Cladophialophora psammophila CBS 110553 TaxID=1182543 RepID=W9VY59_9EURO|nr:uncharacterized protein A1O5_12450 [Cladophialophora psammophila CBS 110553]EXJ57660.1 hypothetical protein A1O5_12450 [Cladophialophora psammophila CBS 110553]